MPNTRRFAPEVLLVLLLAMGVVLQCPLNPDTGYNMIAGRRLLGGDRLYVDMMETNPPMIFWLYAVVAWVGRLTRVTDQRMVGAFVALMIGASGVCGLATLSAVRSRLLRFALFTSFLVALVVPYTIWSGQREQIASLLALPYLLLEISRLRGGQPRRSLAVLVGLLAGIGFTIKPFYLAAWAITEALMAFETRRFVIRIETAAIAAVQCVFVVSVALLTPAYITRLVPMARAFYGAYGRPYTEIVAEPICWGIALVAVSALVVAGARKDETSTATRAFGVVSIGWLIAYVVQGKGWYYQLMPAVAYAGTALILTMLTAVARRPRTVSQRVREVCALVLAVAGAFAARHPIAHESRQFAERVTREQSGMAESLGAYLESTVAGEPVFFMSTDMWPGFPAVNIAGGTWPYHYHFLWPIPALYADQNAERIAFRAPDAQSPAEREFFEMVVNDLVRTPPRVLAVAQSSHQLAMRDRYFDFIAYFSASPAFRNLLTRYRRHDAGALTIFERTS